MQTIPTWKLLSFYHCTVFPFIEFASNPSKMFSVFENLIKITKDYVNWLNIPNKDFLHKYCGPITWSQVQKLTFIWQKWYIKYNRVFPFWRWFLWKQSILNFLYMAIPFCSVQQLQEKLFCMLYKWGPWDTNTVSK